MKRGDVDEDRAHEGHANGDRRRSARFACAGEVKISCLPLDGVFIPGKIIDVSLGGCFVDTASPVGIGARTEIVLRVNSASFRALGEVRAIRGQSGAGVEFVRLSASGKDMLADLVRDLARLQALMSKLKADRRNMDAGLFRREMEEGNLRGARLRDQFLLLRTILPAENAEGEKAETAGADTIKETRLVVPVDLFG
jgi:hypothetical protein